MKKVTMFFLLLFISSACSLKGITVSTVGNVAKGGMNVMMQDDDVVMSRSAAFPLIRQMEVFLQSKPNDKVMLELLSQSYGQYAFGFLEEDVLLNVEDSKKRVSEFYLRGRNYGLLAMGYKEPPKLSIFEKKIKKMGNKDLSKMFWLATSWAGWINYNRDDPLAFAQVPYVQALLDRIIELNRNYENGAVLALNASLLSSKPKMLGGDPDKAKIIFEESINVEPKYLMNKIIFAEHYCMVVGDKELYKTLLNEVIFSNEKFPEQALANALAKRRAKLLINKKFN